jgi:hypothetical protein
VSFQENISDAQSDRKQLARLLAMDHGATVIVTQRWIGWVCSIYSGSSTDRQGGYWLQIARRPRRTL